MNTNSVRDDLAFLRALAEGSEENLRTFAEIYFAAGIIYGGEMLLHAGAGAGMAAAVGPVRTCRPASRPRRSSSLSSW